MIVAVDMDGVVADLHTPWLEWYFRKSGCRLDVKDITDWSIGKFVHPDWTDRIHEFLNKKTCYDHVLPIRGALKGVGRLRRMGHRVVFATSCNIYTAGQKLEWLERHGFLQLEFGTTSKDFISVQSKDLVNADVLIDDGPHNLEAYRKGRGARLAYTCLFDQPWNQADTEHARCRGWKDVIEQMSNLQC